MDDQGYEVEFRWKEQVVYWEGAHGFIFPAGWGVEPPVTYVPSADTWDRVMPGWLVGRRDEVVTRLENEPGHVLSVDPGFHESDGEERTR